MSVLVDSTGQIWMGVGGHGLLRWLGYREWEHWTIADGLQSPIVWSVLRDRRGNIWVGDDRGLNVKSAAAARFHPVAQSLAMPHSASSVLLKIATEASGPAAARGLSSASIPLPLAIRRYSGIPATHQIYADSHNRIWVSTEQGVYVIDDARTSISAHKSGTGSINSSDVYRIVEDKSGTLWAASLSGLFYEQQGDWKPALSLRTTASSTDSQILTRLRTGLYGLFPTLPTRGISASIEIALLLPNPSSRPAPLLFTLSSPAPMRLGICGLGRITASTSSMGIPGDSIAPPTVCSGTTSTPRLFSPILTEASGSAPVRV